MPPQAVILLLRAVNLGKVNKVPMKELMRLLTDEDLGEPSYLLQSGNVVIDDPKLEPDDLKRATERVIAAAFGVTTVAIHRTRAQLESVLAANPFEAREGGSVQVSFWDEPVDPELRAVLEEASRDGGFGADRLHLAENEAYMRFASSSHDSKVGNALIERRLKVRATARNVRTLERLLALGS